MHDYSATRTDSLMLVSFLQSDTNCFSTFNPMDQATYDKVVADWLAAFLISLRHMVKHGLKGQPQGSAAPEG